MLYFLIRITIFSCVHNKIKQVVHSGQKIILPGFEWFNNIGYISNITLHRRTSMHANVLKAYKTSSCRTVSLNNRKAEW